MHLFIVGQAYMRAQYSKRASYMFKLNSTVNNNNSIYTVMDSSIGNGAR